jgi:hypothetical protein
LNKDEREALFADTSTAKAFKTVSRQLIDMDEPHAIFTASSHDDLANASGWLCSVSRTGNREAPH